MHTRAAHQHEELLVAAVRWGSMALLFISFIRCSPECSVFMCFVFMCSACAGGFWHGDATGAGGAATRGAGHRVQVLPLCRAACHTGPGMDGCLVGGSAAAKLCPFAAAGCAWPAGGTGLLDACVSLKPACPPCRPPVCRSAWTPATPRCCRHAPRRQCWKGRAATMSLSRWGETGAEQTHVLGCRAEQVWGDVAAALMAVSHAIHGCRTWHFRYCVLRTVPCLNSAGHGRSGARRHAGSRCSGPALSGGGWAGCGASQRSLARHLSAHFCSLTVFI